MTVRIFVFLSLFACGEDTSGILGDTHTSAPDIDGDGFNQFNDCDDNDPTSTVMSADMDCDGVLAADDCDDGDESYP